MELWPRIRRRARPLASESRHRLLAHPLLQRRFHVVEDGRIGDVDPGGGFLECDARLQAREQIGEVGAAVLEAVVVRPDESWLQRPRIVIGTKTCGREPSMVP